MPKGKLSKKITLKTLTLNKSPYDIIKIIAIITIIFYMIGILPMFTDKILYLFSNPVVKIGFLILILFVAFHDLTIGTLLALAFLVTLGSYMTNVSNRSGQIVGGIGSGINQALGGVGQLVGGVGSGTKQALGGVGKLVKGFESGSQQLVGGIGSGAQQLVGGFGSGAQQLVGGIGSGAQQLVGGIGSGAQQLVGGAEQVVGGITSGTQHLLGGVQQIIGGLTGIQDDGILSSNFSNDNMENDSLMSVSQAYQHHIEQENGDKGCGVQPIVSSGCNPIVGYNSPYNCGCNGKCGGNCGGVDPACLCSGVNVWKDELNTQGLNFPIGYSGNQSGSIY
jgi:hypothetical protein